MFEYNDETDEYVETNPNSETIQECSSLPTQTLSIASSKSWRSSVRHRQKRNARIISKSGRSNTISLRIPKKRLGYMRDWGNTLVSIRWRWIMITLCLANFVSFFMFGMLWMWIAYLSGDFEENATDFCVVNTKSLTGYILMSTETMLTIGYGYRYPTEKCTQGWIVTFMQALVSVAIQGMLVTAVYVKIAKPFTKNALGLFSKKAVICLRDDKLCFVIRITDIVGKIAMGTKVAMYFIDKGFNRIDCANMRRMKIETHGCMIFPVEIVHVIDCWSPLWKMTPRELLKKSIEIVVVVEGQSVITGQPSQNKTSYINSDILWGHRFASCVEYNEKKETYVVNYKNFNKVCPFDTPLCNAQVLNEIRCEMVDKIHKSVLAV